MPRFRKLQPRNLLELIPKRLVSHELEEGTGKVVLLVPRFRNRLARRLFGGLNRDPNFRLRLDEIGAFVWLAIDGRKTAADIAAAARQHFGERVEPAAERVGLFLRDLSRKDLVAFDDPAAPPGQ
jgi:hypothetical protein